MKNRTINNRTTSLKNDNDLTAWKLLRIIEHSLTAIDRQSLQLSTLLEKILMAFHDCISFVLLWKMKFVKQIVFTFIFTELGLRNKYVDDLDFSLQRLKTLRCTLNGHILDNIPVLIRVLMYCALCV